MLDRSAEALRDRWIKIGVIARLRARRPPSRQRAAFGASVG
jgi:hypothetical protein